MEGANRARPWRVKPRRSPWLSPRACSRGRRRSRRSPAPLAPRPLGPAAWRDERGSRANGWGGGGRDAARHDRRGESAAGSPPRGRAPRCRPPMTRSRRAEIHRERRFATMHTVMAGSRTKWGQRLADPGDVSGAGSPSSQNGRSTPTLEGQGESHRAAETNRRPPGLLVGLMSAVVALAVTVGVTRKVLT